MATELRRQGVAVTVYSLTRGEHYESLLTRAGIRVVWIGRLSFPALRIAVLAKHLRRTNPQVVQSTHFFTNLYASLGARSCGAVAIGAIRSNLDHELDGAGIWAKPLLFSADIIVTNSVIGHDNAKRRGLSSDRLAIISNVIDLSAFDVESGQTVLDDAAVVAVAVGGLRRVKRFDRFVEAVARVRATCPQFRGILVGDGPERGRLERDAQARGLSSDALEFAGSVDDVRPILRRANMLVLTSDAEGFPNAVLEAMAARLPVVATRVGDLPRIVDDGRSGYLVETNDIDALAARMRDLAVDRERSQKMGEIGRRIVERESGSSRVADDLIRAYSRAANLTNNRALVAALASHLDPILP